MDTNLLIIIAIAVIVFLLIRNKNQEPYAPLADEPIMPAKAETKKPITILKKDPSTKRRKGALLKASLGQPTSCSASVNMLPKPKADDGFGQFAPDPKELRGKNFIDASRWVTLGAMSTRRNINRDIRSEIPIAKNNGISPWNQSSIDQQQEGRSLDCK
jgi:hypothetical protein